MRAIRAARCWGVVAGICLVVAGVGLGGFLVVWFQVVTTFGRPDATHVQTVVLAGLWTPIALGVFGAIGSARMAVRAATADEHGFGSVGFGTLILHAENDVGREVKKGVRWASIILVALALIAAAAIGFVVSANADSDPPWWSAALFLPAGLCLAWGFLRFWELLGRWRRVGWSIDVFEDGLVEYRFGAVRSAIPFRGGVLDRGGFLLTSPHPLHGPGQFTLAHHHGDQASDVFNAVRMMAERVLVRDALSSLQSGREVPFQGKNAGIPGPALTGRGLRLPDGRQFEYSSLQVKLWRVDDGSRRLTATPEWSEEIEVRCGQESVLRVPQHGPNAIVLREVLLVLTNAKYCEDTRWMYARDRGEFGWGSGCGAATDAVHEPIYPSVGADTIAEMNARSGPGRDDPFADGIDDALSSLPADLRAAISNVEIVVEDEPPDGQPLLGLYRGVPLPRRTSAYSGVLPDKISIFAGPITRLAAGDADRLHREVRHVVLHEIAHHFGISDERLIELDRY